MNLFSRSLLAYVCIVFLFSTCKKDAQIQPTVNNSQATQTFGAYPFAVGREWHYKTTVTIYLGDTTTYEYIKVYRHLKDTILSGTPCFKVAIRNTNINDTSQAWMEYDYYANQEDGLHLLGGEGNAGGFTFFKKAVSKKIKTPLLLPGLSITKIDSVYQPVESLHLTKLPIIFGEEWNSNEYGLQADVKRKWINTENVSVPVGSFNCSKLQIIFGTSNSDNWHIYQDYSSKGLVRVSMRQDSLTTGNGTFGYLISQSELIYTNF